MKNSFNAKFGVLAIIIEIIKWMGLGFILLLALSMYLERFTSNPQANLVGLNIYVVETGSMSTVHEENREWLKDYKNAGKIQVGDLVVVKNLKPNDEIFVGDIVTFNDFNKVIIHRVIDIDGNGLSEKIYTKGDANNAIDPVHTRQEIMGKNILIIPLVGHFIMFIKSKIGLMTMLLVVMLCLIYKYFDMAKKQKSPTLLSPPKKRR